MPETAIRTLPVSMPRLPDNSTTREDGAQPATETKFVSTVVELPGTSAQSAMNAARGLNSEGTPNDAVTSAKSGNPLSAISSLFSGQGGLGTSLPFGSSAPVGGMTPSKMSASFAPVGEANTGSKALAQSFAQRAKSAVGGNNNSNAGAGGGGERGGIMGNVSNALGQVVGAYKRLYTELPTNLVQAVGDGVSKVMNGDATGAVSSVVGGGVDAVRDYGKGLVEVYSSPISLLDGGQTTKQGIGVVNDVAGSVKKLGGA